jgi:hypothetical protein
VSRRERERRHTDLGPEIRCAKCQEFWPEDEEFFFFNKGNAHSWCKACYRADPNIIAKDQRWRESQRKKPAPPAPPPFEFAPLALALRPDLEHVMYRATEAADAAV